MGAVELRNAVAEQYGITLPATAIFDYPSPESLASCVASLTRPTEPVPVRKSIEMDTTGVKGRTSVGIAAVSCTFPGEANGENCIPACCDASLRRMMIFSGTDVMLVQ